LLCLIATRKLIIRCYNRKTKMSQQLYNPVGANGDDEDDDDNYDDQANIRYAILAIV